MESKILKYKLGKMKFVTLALSSSLLLAACSSDNDASEEVPAEVPSTEETVDTTNETEVNEESGGAKGAMSDTLDGVETLADGDYVAGDDIPAGRYEITGKEAGNLMIENNDDRILGLHEILEDDGLNMGVPSVTTDLTEGTEMNLSGMEETRFKPVNERALSNTLTTGTWEVGRDIEPGNYEVSTGSDRSGKIMVYEGIDTLPLVDEPIDPDGELGPEMLEVELEEGQFVIVSVSPELVFE